MRISGKTRWTAAFSFIIVLLVSLGGVTSAASQKVGPGAQELQLTGSDNGGTVDVNGEVLVVNLEGNPSTGYGWQVRGLNGRILRQLEASEWLSATPDKLGGPGTQVLRFAAVGRGQARLDLVYARPWEVDSAPARSFSLEVRVAEPSRNVNYPEPLDSEPMAAPDSGGALTALPGAYNWCDQGGCTPVRDQGNCGSCWAFGTVGAFESAILIQDGASRDLSEQWLVSCNTDGWGCDGGWWAHDYHVSPGSVYESDFPYTATDAPCGGPYTYHEKLTDWVYIGSQSGVPSTDAIKQAIMDHGPVSAAVCVDSQFQAYTGGVFKPSFVWCFSVNHAIVLVGWDDALGAWRLRNSWGPEWGEDGYMWIAYGKAKVGYSANYVVYGGSAPPAPPAAPSGLAAAGISISQIDLSWTDNAANESGFKVERSPDGITWAQVATTAANATTYSDTGLAASTTYYYQVRAYNDAGDSAYSNTASATTLTPPAPPAAPSDLAAAAISTSQIDLSWTDNAANEDGFQIEGCSGVDCTGFAQIATVGPNVTGYSNTGLAAATSYSYRVRAYNVGGNSDWTNTATAVTEAPPPVSGGIWLSLAANGSVSGLGTVNDEDIIALDKGTGVYSWVFDGSDVGIGGDIDAFDVLDNGNILMSFDGNQSVAGVGTVADPDIVEFAPTSLGSTTAGTFSWKFDGSDVGLSSSSEDVDALFFLADGTMVVSFRNSFGVTGISGQDEDLIRFTATRWGSTTAGTWSWYLDGSDIGLSSSDEDVDGVWLDQAISPNPDVYLSTLGNFSVTGISGANEDILVFKPTALGSTTAGTFSTPLFLDGSLFGLGSYDIDAFDVR